MAGEEPTLRPTGRHIWRQGTPGACTHDDRRALAEELAEEIERARDELGATVEAFAAKADVKARALEKAADVSRAAKRAASSASQRRMPLAVAVSAALLAGWLIVTWRRR